MASTGPSSEHLFVGCSDRAWLAQYKLRKPMQAALQSKHLLPKLALRSEITVVPKQADNLLPTASIPSLSGMLTLLNGCKSLATAPLTRITCMTDKRPPPRYLPRP